MGVRRRSALVSAAVAIAALSSGAGVARSANGSPYASDLVMRGDIPQINPYTLTIARVRRPTLRVVYGDAVARWMRSHGFAGGAAEVPQFQEPGVTRPDSGEAQASVAAFRHSAGAAASAARYLRFNQVISDERGRAPLRVAAVPSARILVVYGKHTGGTASHPAAAVAIWTEGSCMLSVSVGGYTAKAKESYTRYAERVLHRIEGRTDGRCSVRRWRYGGGLV